MNKKIVPNEVVGNFSIFGNEGLFWVNVKGDVLYFDLKVWKENPLPSDTKVNTLISSALNVEVRSFDDAYLDKGTHWAKSFSYWLGDAYA